MGMHDDPFTENHIRPNPPNQPQQNTNQQTQNLPTSPISSTESDTPSVIQEQINQINLFRQSRGWSPLPANPTELEYVMSNVDIEEGEIHAENDNEMRNIIIDKIHNYQTWDPEKEKEQQELLEAFLKSNDIPFVPNVSQSQRPEQSNSTHTTHTNQNTNQQVGEQHNPSPIQPAAEGLAQNQNLPFVFNHESILRAIAITENGPQTQPGFGNEMGPWATNQLTQDEWALAQIIEHQQMMITSITLRLQEARAKRSKQKQRHRQRIGSNQRGVMFRQPQIERPRAPIPPMTKEQKKDKGKRKVEECSEAEDEYNSDDLDLYPPWQPDLEGPSQPPLTCCIQRN